MSQITLFAKDGRGQKSSNEECIVTYADVNFDKLSDEQKSNLVRQLVFQLARQKYSKLSAGFKSASRFMETAKELLAQFGGVDIDEAKLQSAAQTLAKREGKEIVFTPVVAFELSEAEILSTDEPDETEESAN